MTRYTCSSIVAVKSATGLSIILTRSTGKARWAFADEPIWCVTGNSTGPSITTWFPFAAIKYQVTMSTCVSSATLAAVVVGQLDAAVSASGVTGVGQTLVDVSFTSFPDISRGAEAVVASNSIHTLPFVETLGLLGHKVNEWGAVVNVDFTVNSLGSPGTRAFVGIDQVNTGAPILAWLGEALIDFI